MKKIIVLLKFFICQDAVALLKEFNNSPMAAYNLSQAEMNSLLDYLK